jgi:hypothetical protein
VKEALNVCEAKALIIGHRYDRRNVVAVSTDHDWVKLRLVENLAEASDRVRFIDRLHDASATGPRFGRWEIGARLNFSWNGFRSRFRVSWVGLWRGLSARTRFGLAIPTLAANSFTLIARTTLANAA